jgi:hypothetical protein
MISGIELRGGYIAVYSREGKGVRDMSKTCIVPVVDEDGNMIDHGDGIVSTH